MDPGNDIRAISGSGRPEQTEEEDDDSDEDSDGIEGAEQRQPSMEQL